MTQFLKSFFLILFLISANSGLMLAGDLKEWKLLKTLSGVGSDIKFTDIRKSIFEKQYYRVKALE